MTTGKIEFPLGCADFIKDVRKGIYEAEELFLMLLSNLDNAKELEKTDKNILRKEPEVDFLDVIYNVYKNFGDLE